MSRCKSKSRTSTRREVSCSSSSSESDSSPEPPNDADTRLNWDNLYQAKKVSDAVVATVERENDELKRKVAEYEGTQEIEDARSSKRARRKSRAGVKDKGESSENPETLVSHTYRDCGRRFALTFYLWLDLLGLAHIGSTEPDDLDLADWFTDKDTPTLYFAEALRSCLRQPDLVGGLKESHRQNDINYGMTDIRSTKSSLIREKIVDLFGSDYDATLLVDIEAHSTNQDLKKLNGYTRDGDSSHYDIMNVPILHEGGLRLGNFNKDTFLRHPSLIKICVLIFWGKAAFKQYMQQKWPPSLSGQVLATKWALREVTVGMIVTSAILARWAISPDVQFQADGAESGISYRDCVDEYTGYLQKGLGKNKPSVKALFNHWNNKLFPGRAQRKKTPEDVLAARSILDAETSDDGNNSESDREVEADGNQGGGEGA